MARYRKKPLEVEAVPVEEILAGVRDELVGLPEWADRALNGDPESDEGYGRLCRLLPTHGGVQVRTKQDQWVSAEIGEWIVWAADDDLWPIDAEVFDASYEPV